MELKDAQALADRLLRAHGLWDAGWHFNWDRARKRGGKCEHTFKRITMSIYLVPLWSEDEVRATLMHEIAHALVGPGQGHGPAWRSKMRELGEAPVARHNNTVLPSRWGAQCPTHGIIATRQRRRSGVLSHAGCGQIIEWVDTFA